MSTPVFSPDAPAALGPYSQAILVGDTLYTSGQLGLDGATGLLADGVAAQTQLALTNLGHVLRQAGMTHRNVVKTTVFLQNMEDFAAVNQVYAGFFPENPPARSCVAVAQLPKNALVEIECVATR